MKKVTLSLILVMFSVVVLNAQANQFAVVRPDGTTYICPTFDSAYNKAQNDDRIYLPGGNFSLTNPINKRIFIYGAGYDIDSSASTGITTVGNIKVFQGGENGSLEGIQINNSQGCATASLTLGDNINPIAGYTISRCNLTNGIEFKNSCTNIMIKNNRIGGYGCQNSPEKSSLGGNLSNSLITNNVILSSILLSNSTPNLTVNNNLFFFAAAFYYLTLANYSIYNNNIFQSGTTYVNYSTFNNNSNISPQGTGNILLNNVSENFSATFINPGSPSGGIYYYDSHNNYHINLTSACHNSGTDGTDRGKYGGNFPWSEGSVPSNPHIYFKQVAPETNASGQLNIQFKVRTNN